MKGTTRLSCINRQHLVGEKLQETNPAPLLIQRLGCFEKSVRYKAAYKWHQVLSSSWAPRTRAGEAELGGCGYSEGQFLPFAW